MMFKMPLVGALLACALLALAACGDDGQDKGPAAPEIASASLECGPYVGEGDPKADGDILLRLEAVVSDPDGDLAGVTATFGGALLTLTDQGSSIFAYDQGGEFNKIARCTGEEAITIIAVDALGNEAILTEDKITR